MVNPSIIFKGRYQRRCIAMKEYDQTKYEISKNSDELRLFTIKKNIDQLEKKKANLESKLNLKKLQERMETKETEEKKRSIAEDFLCFLSFLLSLPFTKKETPIKSFRNPLYFIR